MNVKVYPDRKITDRLNIVLLRHRDSYWTARINCERKTINSWKSGKTQPRASQIKTICKYSGVSADWLLGLSEEMRGD